jgi:uncharacterized RDD family membrane protein YckC
MMDDSISVGQLRVVGPDGSIIYFEAASLASRIGARLLDFLMQAMILLAIAMIVGIAGFTAGEGSGPILIVISYFAGFIVLLLYQPILEVTRNGQSLGKSATGIRVVQVDGSPVRSRQSLLRAAADVVEIYATFGSIALVTSLCSRQGQRLGDHLAGTVVVSTQTSLAPHAAQFSVPPQYLGLVDSLDVSALTQADYELVRVTLLRAPTLSPQVRFDNASMVVKRIAPKCNLELGPLHHPESYLGCVAVAYQRRSDRQREFKSAQRQEVLGGRGEITAFTRIVS